MERGGSRKIAIILDCCYAGIVRIGRKGSEDDWQNQVEKPLSVQWKKTLKIKSEKANKKVFYLLL
jgi:hypothetical protein